MAQFHNLRHNCTTFIQIAPKNTLSVAANLLDSIQECPSGLTLAELLALHPNVVRRTAQRGISQLIGDGRIAALGEGRTRRYLTVRMAGQSTAKEHDVFLGAIPSSANSRDILAYVDQPLAARKPVDARKIIA